jgi:hypothetical protein
MQLNYLFNLPLKLTRISLWNANKPMIDFRLGPETVRDDVGDEVLGGGTRKALGFIKLSGFITKFAQTGQKLVI